jgi:hypothetical protein
MLLMSRGVVICAKLSELLGGHPLRSCYEREAMVARESNTPFECCGG